MGTVIDPLGNYVIEGVGNNLIETSPQLGNSVIVNSVAREAVS
jgi:hypothetical protein